MGSVRMQNHKPVTLLQACACALLAGNGALATEQEVGDFGPVLNACLANAADGAALRACIGRMSTACMDGQEGGHTTLGMTSCLNAEARVWDGVLNAEYKASRAFAKAMDADEAAYFPEFARRAEALLAAQRAWIAFRDAECDLAHAEWGSGSMRNIAWADCQMQMTAERAIELRDMRETFE